MENFPIFLHFLVFYKVSTLNGNYLFFLSVPYHSLSNLFDPFHSSLGFDYIPKLLYFKQIVLGRVKLELQ